VAEVGLKNGVVPEMMINIPGFATGGIVNIHVEPPSFIDHRFEGFPNFILRQRPACKVQAINGDIGGGAISLGLHNASRDTSKQLGQLVCGQVFGLGAGFLELMHLDETEFVEAASDPSVVPSGKKWRKSDRFMTGHFLRSSFAINVFRVFLIARL
jgi:hypothetical protein